LLIAAVASYLYRMVIYFLVAQNANIIYAIIVTRLMCNFFRGLPLKHKTRQKLRRNINSQLIKEYRKKKKKRLESIFQK
jgi:hypothetical protein